MSDGCDSGFNKMSKHTPGPWQWQFNKTSKSVHLVGGKPLFDKTVMQFGRWGMGGAVPFFNSAITGHQWNIMERLSDMPGWLKPFPGREHHSHWHMDVTHPDAVLMAAAPELLEALQCLLRLQCEGKGYWAPGADMARAAITKATGSAP